MTFYQELQLNSAGSKALIRITEDKKERRRHILIYNFKVYLVVAFCFAAVTLAWLCCWLSLCCARLILGSTPPTVCCVLREFFPFSWLAPG